MQRYGGLLLPVEARFERPFHALDRPHVLQFDIVAVLAVPRILDDTVVTALSLSMFELLGSISFRALGLISVVAISRNSSSRNIRSVIDDAEKDLSTFDPCLIAIARYF